MKRYLFRGAICAIIGLASFLVACHKMDETYEGFLTGGEMKYAKKPDTIWISPGKNRLKLSTVLIGTNYSKYMVYWNDGQDSLEVPVGEKKYMDTLEVLIAPLAEGDCAVKVYTYDMEQYRSIVTEANGVIYGDAYQSTLFNRIALAFQLDDKGKPLVMWDSRNPRQAVAVELVFKDQEQMAHRLIQPIEETKTAIAYDLLGDSLQYRTLFLPDSNAIDTFYTQFQTLHLP